MVSRSSPAVNVAAREN